MIASEGPEASQLGLLGLDTGRAADEGRSARHYSAREKIIYSHSKGFFSIKN